jgi:hypothetical protein
MYYVVACTACVHVLCNCVYVCTFVRVAPRDRQGLRAKVGTQADESQVPSRSFAYPAHLAGLYYITPAQIIRPLSHKLLRRLPPQPQHVNDPRAERRCASKTSVLVGELTFRNSRQGRERYELNNYLAVLVGPDIYYVFCGRYTISDLKDFSGKIPW